MELVSLWFLWFHVFGFSAIAALVLRVLVVFLVNFAVFSVFCSFTFVLICAQHLPFCVWTLMLPESSRTWIESVKTHRLSGSVFPRGDIIHTNPTLSSSQDIQENQERKGSPGRRAYLVLRVLVETWVQSVQSRTWTTSGEVAGGQWWGRKSLFLQAFSLFRWNQTGPILFCVRS